MSSMPFDDRAPSSSAALYTAPSEHVRQYDLSVSVPWLRVRPQYFLHPWVRIVADAHTDDVRLAAGIKATPRHVDDDGA